jgi:GNAT superfamily N-acetyltransferase
MEKALILSRLSVRRLGEGDIPAVLSLCLGNPLYYEHCPPPPSEDSVRADMAALPPKKEACDKYYLGFFDGESLVAVLDLILGYPDEETAFIGFFMTEASIQHAGVGSGIIGRLCGFLKAQGFSRARLGFVSGNPQSEGFWKKNGFIPTGETYKMELYTVALAERRL